MAKKRRQAKIPTPAWERPRGTIGSRVLGRGFQFYGAVLIGVLLAAGLSVIGYAFLDNYLERQGRPGSTAIQVEDTRFRLDYFSNRLTMFVNQNGGVGAVEPSGALPAVSDLLIREEVVRRFAGELDVTVTEEEIREEIASRLGITLDDETYDVVFQQELARSEIREADYLQMIEAAVLERKLREKFEEDLPESAESVRYRQIVVSEQEKADELVSELEGGADFAALAAEDFNLDVANKDRGGNVGWVPRGGLDASTEELVFALEPGEISTIPTLSVVLVVEMLKKDDDHPVAEDQRGPLAGRAFGDWVQDKRQPLEDAGAIVNNMDGGDPDKINWAIRRVYGG